MSNFAPTNSLAFFLEVNKDFPEEWDVFLQRFLEAYRDIARASNAKDIGLYEEEELQNGQQFFPNPTTTFTTTNRILRQAYRKVIDMGTVITGVNLVPHGIAVGTPSTFTFTRIYGVVQDQTAPLFVPAPNDNIHLEVDATDVSLRIPALYNTFTAIVILEYLKN